MSIAFGGAMKDLNDDVLTQMLRKTRKIAQKRKRITTVRQISSLAEQSPITRSAARKSFTNTYIS